MIVYKIDKQSHSRTNAQIRDMATVLEEIPATLETLLEIIEQQELAFVTPSINAFRSELQQSVKNAVSLTKTVAERSQKLASVSDEASKHLLAIEDHFGAVLRKASQPQPN
jgi:methyl-accepting chemotaxis protein